MLDNLPFLPVRMVAWWNCRGDEVDIAAIGERPYRILLGDLNISAFSTYMFH